MPTDLDTTCSGHPAPESSASLTGAAMDLVAAARRLSATSGTLPPADDDARAALALLGDALGHLGAATAQIAQRLETLHAASADHRPSADTARRMNELISALAYARYSAHVAGREIPDVERRKP